ncbi:MAG: tail fiber protein [Chloroflexi bacterium]|nr:tail fiber protein [Chloroflexota bacterium]
MPFTETARHTLRRLTGGSLVSDVDAGFTALADDVDAKMLAGSRGALSIRPDSTPSSPGVINRVYYATDIGLAFLDYGTGWAPIGVPIGGGFDWFGSGDPCDEIVICNGRELSRTTYATLFALIETQYGAGNGSTTFNIPDTRGKMLVGVSPSFGPGNTGGEETHGLTIAEMPSHSHTSPDFSRTSVRNDVAQTDVLIDSVGANSPGMNSGLAGGGGQHNNMPPYLAAHKCIRII